MEPLPHWKSPCYWFSFHIVSYRFKTGSFPHLFPIGADGAFFRAKNREQMAAKEAPARLSEPQLFDGIQGFYSLFGHILCHVGIDGHGGGRIIVTDTLHDGFQGDTLLCQ